MVKQSFRTDTHKLTRHAWRSWMMTKVLRTLFITLCAGLYACVTVNVYFPAAALEQAADRIVKEIYGAKLKEMEQQEKAPVPEGAPPAKDKSGAVMPGTTALEMMLNALVPPAYAQQPDIDVDTPAI